jgi:SET domain-containing protein
MARLGFSTITPLTPDVNPRYAAFNLEIRESGIHRWGVFALEDIPAKRKVIEYTGEKLNRIQTKQRANEHGRLVYLFTLDAYWAVDGARGGSGAEYINHSCDPNLETRILKGHILFMSLRGIRAGEELTLDYRFAKNVERHECKCGSPKCRGTINLLK